MPISCPPADALLGYLHGKTRDAESETIEVHIADCPTCQLLLERLAEESDSLMNEIAGAVKSRTIMGATGIADDAPAVNLDNQRSYASSADDQPAAELQSKVIAGCRILDCIGQGGMGSVYRAWHVRLDKQVALKILKPERMGAPEAIMRFALEMKLLARLEHNNIVRAMDGGEQDGLPYFVMEFVGGINLQQLVRRVGPLPVQDVCHIGRLAASALQYAHDQKIIHRDVKPSNLMLTADGNVKLLDLGLAQCLTTDAVDALTRVDQVLGTLDYMSPEQLSSRPKVTHQSDIFSLGVTLHELLTGLRPSGRLGLPPQATVIQSIRPDVDSSLITLVAEMLAVNPSDRPLSMSEVELRLNAIAEPANLSALLAEYYRWSSRGVPVRASRFARADTEASVARSTDSQSTDRESENAPAALLAWKKAGFIPRVQSIALIGCVAALGWMAVAPWFQKPELPRVAERETLKADTSKELGSPAAEKNVDSVTSRVEVTGESDFATELLKDGRVSIEDLLSGKFYTLYNGNFQLAPGKYKLHYEAPIEFRANGTEIEISPASTQTRKIEAQLAEGFQYPVFPEAGAVATYYGKLWLAGWGEHHEPSQEMSYTLNLEVLADEFTPEVSKWLLVEITDSANKYTETSYIKVDIKLWEKRRELKILDGYIAAKSPEIERFLVNQGRDPSGNGLVVPFDRQKDLLGELNGVVLPTRRLRAQDAIALFFAVEDQMPVAAEPICTARQKLSQLEREEWLGPVKTPYGTPKCYIASSRTMDQKDSDPGYRLARRKSDDAYPFGIVEIQVTSPNIYATCTIKNTGSVRADSQLSKPDVAKKLASLKLDVDKTIAGKMSPPARETPILPSLQIGRFDLALIPKVPGITIWSGSISHGTRRSETVELTARVLGTERIGDREYRWLEVAITSTVEGRPYWEGARLAVDAVAYEKDNVLSIRKGWIAFDNRDNVFEFPESGNLDELMEMRLKLQQQPQMDRVGISDALSSLFNAKLSPPTPISRLRADINGILAGSDRKSIPETRTLRNKTYSGEHRKSPDLFPGLNYSFFRSPQVPFGFASVNLKAGGIVINLEVDSEGNTPPNDFANSIFLEPEKLMEAFDRNMSRMPQDPNWRVWTWSESGKTYMAWAEFGGTIKQRTGIDVLLRNAKGAETCVPEILLGINDQEFVRKGRHWATFPDDSQRVLLEDNVKSKELTFLRMDGTKRTFEGGLTNIDDVAWLDALRAAIKRNANSTKSTDAWRAFAGYMR